MVGSTISDGAFFSSSLSSEAAEDFATDLILKINAPAGSKCAFVGNLSEYAEAESYSIKDRK